MPREFLVNSYSVGKLLTSMFRCRTVLLIVEAILQWFVFPNEKLDLVSRIWWRSFARMESFFRSTSRSSRICFARPESNFFSRKLDARVPEKLSIGKNRSGSRQPCPPAGEDSQNFHVTEEFSWLVEPNFNEKLHTIILRAEITTSRKPQHSCFPPFKIYSHTFPNSRTYSWTNPGADPRTNPWTHARADSRTNSRTNSRTDSGTNSRAFYLFPSS